MAASNIRAGGAFVELFIKDSSVQKTLGKVKKDLRAWGQSIQRVGLAAAGLGTLVGAPLLAATKSFASYAAGIDDMSQRTGASAEALQELGFAASQSGSDIDALEGGIAKMQKTIAGAAGGSKTAVAALAKLGVTAAQLKGMSPDQQLAAIADGLAKIEDPAMRTAAAMGVFGKSGAKLIPMLADGAAGLEALRAEARRLGLVLNNEDVAAAAALDDSLDSLSKSAAGMKNAFGAALAVPLKTVADTLATFAGTIGRFIHQNRGLVIGASVAAVALLTFGGALIAVGTAVQVTAFAVSGLATLLVTIGTVFSTIAGSPLLLVLGGLTALTLAFPKLRQTAGETLGFLTGNFGQLLTIAQETFDGISDAMSGGDLQAAARVLWAGLHLAWLTGTEQLRAVQNEASNIAAEWGNNLFTGLRAAWILTTDFMLDTWDKLVASLTGVWSSVQNAVTLTLASIFDTENDGLGFGDVVDSLRSMQAEAEKTSSAATAKRIADREKATRAALIGIAEEHAEQKRSLEDEIAGRRTVMSGALEAARKEQQAARAAAAEARRNGVKSPAGITAAASSLASTLASGFGSFSAAGLNRVGVSGLGGVEEATRETADNTEEIANLLRDGGLAFA